MLKKRKKESIIQYIQQSTVYNIHMYPFAKDKQKFLVYLSLVLVFLSHQNKPFYEKNRKNMLKGAEKHHLDAI